MAHVLVEAEEGELGEIFSAPNLDKLRESVKRHYTDEAADSRSYGIDEDGWHRQNEDALLKMLDGAPTTPGHHMLKPIEPHWHEWALVIVLDEPQEPPK
jgi:hypothetical protein